MSGIWSQKIEKRFSLRLPEDVCAWLDQKKWQEPSGAEFCRALTPEQLLDPESGTIWAGFMLPDTIPIIGNDYGDWLCLRIAADGTVRELIHWSHCGGDWIPYGRNLAEALLYDAAVRVLHPDRLQMVDLQLPREQVFRAAEWALAWLPPSHHQPIPPFWGTEEPVCLATDTSILEMLEQQGIAEFAIARDRILSHLESPLKVASGPELAQRMQVAWEPDFVRWLFDTDLIPARKRRELGQLMDASRDGVFAQDWAAAERTAKSVIQRRQDLGWAFDIAGWAAQRRGDGAAAVKYYLAGLQTSWFSDDTVRFRTHWFDERYGKFAASRLATLDHCLNDQQRGDSYLRIFLENDSDPQSLQQRVHQYWLNRAHVAQQRGEHARAYEYYYQAGWDLGLQTISDYDEIFDGLRKSANAMNALALAAVAEMHQRFLCV